MTHQDGRGFSLTVTVPADDYADLERRLVFLEAVAVQLLRERCRIREWFTAADLQALALPGLPTARNAITRAARKQGWALRKVRVKGGLRHEYHYTSLPRRAFDALIERVRRPSYAEIGAEPRAEIPSIPAFPQTVPASKNTAPAWVLPLVRLLRAKEGATLNQALARLPALLPSGMVGPTQAEAVAVLRDLGMVNDQ